MSDKNSLVNKMRLATGAEPMPTPLNNPWGRPLLADNPVQQPTGVGKVPPPKKATKVKPKKEPDASDR